MFLLRKVASFRTPLEYLKTTCVPFIRSVLEQSATVWHISISEENIKNLESVQKSAIRCKKSFKMNVQN